MGQEVFGLFPTPLMRVDRCVNEALLAALLARSERDARQANVHSGQLSHSEIVDPASDPALAGLSNLLLPRLVGFGEVLFGEFLRWTIKEMWINVLEAGGHQAVHAHANSFVSGIVYLTPSHPSANTVFHKSLGGTGFVFSNFHKGAKVGPFNGERWVLPEVGPGDLVLYPSYLLHEVPENRGGRRVTIAFNAMPDRLDSSGYAIRFTK